jgi:hypothetical protein
MNVEHKEIVWPDVDLSHDEGDPAWHEAQASGEALGACGSTPLRNEDGEIYGYQWNGLEPGHYAEYWQLCVKDEWEQLSAAYELAPDDVHHAYWYVDSHPAFWCFEKKFTERPENHLSNLVHNGAWPRSVDLAPHKVDPVTRRIEDEESRNILTEWWYEFGPWDLLPRVHGSDAEPRQSCYHDYLLDGGALTYDQAVLDIALKVHTHYGNDRRIVDSPEWVSGEYEYKL